MILYLKGVKKFVQHFIIEFQRTTKEIMNAEKNYSPVVACDIYSV